ncbi:hypothetical protein F2Q70_00036727 [Brassica cretica]|uniref:Uncharacterized protein n=1 Tax=Brassica cretica TaxID=69181 RepID=A0A8S9JPF7_BRACR|nr:hypothetical protein F2Q68_00032019 [Brassica cretica]KAF2583609.1 hypothetical protein F2Q70_00036727 [Brassica cretica]KAF3600130.1 hypothetical protein F2Q69_00037508 [Brassica cretica]
MKGHGSDLEDQGNMLKPFPGTCDDPAIGTKLKQSRERGRRVMTHEQRKKMLSYLHGNFYIYSIRVIKRIEAHGLEVVD